MPNAGARARTRIRRLHPRARSQPRPLLVALAAASSLLLLAALPSGASAGPAASTMKVNVARQRAELARQAFAARMAARADPHAVAPSPQAAPLAGSAAGAAFSAIRNVKQISRDTLPSIRGAEPDTQAEPDIAIDPRNPKIFLTGFQQGRYHDGGSVDPGFATSQDGGRTWADGNLPKLTIAVGGAWERASDIAAAFGPDGSAYLQTIPFNMTNCRSGIAIQRSTNGGLSFGRPVLTVDDNDCNIFNDKNWLTVDTFRSSPHLGRIYAVWSRFIATGPTTTISPATISWSDDKGRTWTPFRFISAATDSTEGVLPLVRPDGSVTVVYDQTIGSQDFEVSQTSHDGGATWGPQVRIGQFLGAFVPNTRSGGLPTATVDPVTGDLYAAWEDARFNPAGLNDIVLSRSRDGGATWSAPQAVTPREAGVTRFTPDVAAAGGAVHLTYRSRGGGGTATTVTEDYLASTDRGATFGAQHVVGPPSAVRWAAQASGTLFFWGDYMGVAATPTEAALVWNVSSKPPVAGEAFHQTTWGAVVLR
jgi:hypothetical protein